MEEAHLAEAYGRNEQATRLIAEQKQRTATLYDGHATAESNELLREQTLAQMIHQRDFGFVSVSRPPHREHFKCCPISGTGMWCGSGTVLGLTFRSCPQRCQ